MLVKYPTVLMLKIVLISLELSSYFLFVALQKLAGTARIYLWSSRNIFVEIKENFFPGRANRDQCRSTSTDFSDSRAKPVLNSVSVITLFPAVLVSAGTELIFLPVAAVFWI